MKPKKEETPKKVVKREAPPVVKEQWEGVALKLKPGSGELIAYGENNSKAYSRRDDAKAIQDSLPEDILKRLKKKKELKNINVVVRKETDCFVLLEIKPNS